MFTRSSLPLAEAAPRTLVTTWATYLLGYVGSFHRYYIVIMIRCVSHISLWDFSSWWHTICFLHCSNL